MSEELDREIDRAAVETESSESEVLRRALTLYLAARDARQRGLKIGTVERSTDKLQTEFIGL